MYTVQHTEYSTVPGSVYYEQYFGNVAEKPAFLHSKENTFFTFDNAFQWLNHHFQVS